MGETTRHGPHQGAHTSTTTADVPDVNLSKSVLPISCTAMESLAFFEQGRLLKSAMVLGPAARFAPSTCAPRALMSPGYPTGANDMDIRGIMAP